jgi:succinate dehydrogenase / fumarate reductase flavoprotein subunit
MGTYVGIFREEKDLEAGLAELEKLKARVARVRVTGSREYNPGWHLARDLRNLLIVSEALTRSALLRRESRGAHARLDFTGPDPALGLVNMCARRDAGGMRVEPSPLPVMPPELKALFEAAPAKAT